MTELEGESLSPQARAFHELGIKLLEESLRAGREFAALMIKFAFGSVPVYIGLVQFLVPLSKDSDLDRRLYLTTPLGFFVAASVLFIISYLPQRGSISLDVVEDVKHGYRAATQSRRALNLLGTTLFIVGIGTACYVLIFSG